MGDDLRKLRPQGGGENTDVPGGKDPTRASGELVVEMRDRMSVVEGRSRFEVEGSLAVEAHCDDPPSLGDQLTTVVKAAGSWKKILERNGLDDRVAAVCEKGLSATDRVFLALAGLAHSERDLEKIASRLMPDGSGDAVSNPALLSGSVGSIGFRNTPLQVLR